MVVTHGNGPQVGRILLQQEAAAEWATPMPLDVCGAQSQGQIGYMLQVATGDVFFERGDERPVVTVLTLTRVCPDDPAFDDPTKPIGSYCQEEEAKRLASERGWHVRPAPDGGWRRVVPSPDPYSIVEAPMIQTLVAEGAVDKDLAAAILARDVRAQTLMILTDVDAAYRGYGTSEQERLARLVASEAREMLDRAEFGSGSMGPKVLGAIRFVESGGERSVIGSLDRALDALAGEAGTTIVA